MFPAADGADTAPVYSGKQRRALLSPHLTLMLIGSMIVAMCSLPFILSSSAMALPALLGACARAHSTVMGNAGPCQPDVHS